MDPVGPPRHLDAPLQVVVVEDVPLFPHVFGRFADDLFPADVHDRMREPSGASEEFEESNLARVISRRSGVIRKTGDSPAGSRAALGTRR